MRLAVLGATGDTGVQVVKQALHAGHQVRVLARTPSKVTITHNSLEVVKADIFSVESLTRSMNGCEAVISCLGSEVTFCSRVTLYSESMRCITAAMRAAGVTRIIAMSSAYARPSAGEGCCIPCWARGMFFRTILADMALMEIYLKDMGADLQWTVVKPWVLNDKPLDMRKPMAVEGEYVPDAISAIPRANVAEFMLDQLVVNTWHNKAVAIGLLKESSKLVQ